MEGTGIEIRPVQQKPAFNSISSCTKLHDTENCPAQCSTFLFNIYNCCIIWNSV